MIIVWRDTDLKRHEIDLTDAVDVKIKGFAITEYEDCISVSSYGSITVAPVAANRVNISEVPFKPKKV